MAGESFNDELLLALERVLPLLTRLVILLDDAGDSNEAHRVLEIYDNLTKLVNEAQRK